MAADIVFLNGEYIPKSQATISPDDRAFVFGDGVYEVARAYHGRLFALDRHLERMQAGLDALRISASAAAYESMFTELLDRNALGSANALVYVQITRGAAPRVHRFPDAATTPTVYATAWAFQGKGDPNGVTVITAPDTRWSRCDIKSLNLLGNCLAAQLAYEAGAFEAVLVRDGMALEASAASFFGVFDGEIRTAPKSNYILPSITRDVAIELCRAEGLPVAERPIAEPELRAGDEFFLASTTMEIMPVTRINDMTVGDGAPGPVTRQVRDLVAAITGANAPSPV